MAILTITGFDDATLVWLERLASRNGTSMDEEARRLIEGELANQARMPKAQNGFDRNEALAGAEALRQLVMAANSRRMPDDSVDQFIAEKRA